MYDRVITVNTKDPAGKDYASKEYRLGAGAAFRYAFGRTATAPMVMATLGYSRQGFSIVSGTLIGIPNVEYSIVEPGAGLRLPVTSNLIIGLDAKLMLITGTGQIQDPAQYGAASVLGFEGALGVDYLITRNIFARAAFRYETIGITFKGDGMLSNARDGDPASVDVPGARDNYIGGLATVGYLY
jgi:opacity protein-like surface antigen